MVPAVVVVLEALPLTATGKIDRQALPEPGRTGAVAGHVAPRTPTEEVLAGIWGRVLGLPRVGAHDDFVLIWAESRYGPCGLSARYSRYSTCNYR